MLLVDHQQAEVGDRSEDGRAGPDADARLAASQSSPLVVALAVGEGRVQDRDAIPEPGPKPGHRLRSQADLGDEDDRPLAASERRLDRRQVDLGLARAGDAVQQQRALPGGGAAVDRSDDLLDCGLLLRKQLGPPRGSAHRSVLRRPSHGRAASRDQAALLEPAQDLAIGPDRRRELLGGQLARFAQRLEHRALPDAEPLAAAQRLLARRGDLGPQLDPRAHPLPGGSGPRRQHQRQPARRGRAVLAPHPEPEPDQLGGGARLQRFERLSEALGRQLRALRPPDDDAEHPAVAEGDADDAADLEILHRLRKSVVERTAQSAGIGQRLDFGNRHLATVWRPADADVCWRR